MTAAGATRSGAFPASPAQPPDSGTLLASPRLLWQAAHRDVVEGEASPGPGMELSGPWRLLLLGDGSPTRHLQTLSGLPVEIEVIAMAAEPERPAGGLPPDEVADLAGPLLRRQVWLRCGDQTLAWAESWWNQTLADLHLRERHQPIWRSLTSRRAELFREVDGLALVEATPWLAERFGSSGPYWARHYRFFRGGEPLTVIREVFSPAISRWLGPSGREL